MPAARSVLSVAVSYLADSQCLPFYYVVFTFCQFAIDIDTCLRLSNLLGILVNVLFYTWSPIEESVHGFFFEEKVRPCALCVRVVKRLIAGPLR